MTILNTRARKTIGMMLIRPERFGDDHGWFTEVYSVLAFVKLGMTKPFVQYNRSLSVLGYTMRDLHFQMPARARQAGGLRPRADLRRCGQRAKRLAHLGRWVGAELSAENGHQLFIPIGSAHGFVTLEPDCEVKYKCSHTYAPEQTAAF